MSCLNRILKEECSNNCHCGSNCTNINFRKKIYQPLILFETEFTGIGVKSERDLKM